MAAAPPSPPPAAARPELATIVERVQKRYDGTQDYRAHFDQVQLNAAFGRTTRSSGEVLFKKPGRMRWDYDKPEKKTFVSNGQVLWLYEPEDQQAFRQDLKSSQLPAALAFLMGKGKLTDEFEVTFADDAPYGRPGDYRLSLKPRQPQGRYKSIYFLVDPQTFHIRETVLIDAQGNVNDVSFGEPKINTKLADATFKWSPPAGVKVVDTSKLR
jgi:outer membrane lipoprotein carrier protein